MARLVDLLGAGPAPRLAALLASARAAGAHVTWPPGPALDPALEAGAHRIVQEALTNALKHAPGAAIDVQVDLGDDALTIVVANALPGRVGPLAASGSGLGLAGMAERVAALGGDLEAGPAGDGGFVLRARLPRRGAAAPAS
jgi:signal transduction histidine kinase